MIRRSYRKKFPMKKMKKNKNAADFDMTEVCCVFSVTGTAYPLRICR